MPSCPFEISFVFPLLAYITKEQWNTVCQTQLDYIISFSSVYTLEQNRKQIQYSNVLP